MMSFFSSAKTRAVLMAFVFSFSLVEAFAPVSRVSFHNHKQLRLRPSPRHVPTKTFHNSDPTKTSLHVLPILLDEGTSILTAVNIFPGSSVVDPVVVSNAFWDGLVRQFVSLVIGQILAVIGFGMITTFASTQINKFTSTISETIFKESSSTTTKSPLKKPPPGYTGEKQQVDVDFQKLAICLLIDAIGTSSELVPFVGELTDLVWAPIAATMLRKLYYGSNVVFALELAEEALLFTDVLPLATICWVVDTFFVDSQVAKVLQLGIYRNTPEKQQSARDEATIITTSAERIEKPDRFVTIDRTPPNEINMNELVTRNAVSGGLRPLQVDSNNYNATASGFQILK